MRRVLFVPLLLLAGCTDFPTPAELTKPTILAIVAEPPLIGPGASTELTLVLAGPDGPMTPAAVDWAIAESYPGVPVFGTVEPGPDGTATYTAPDPLPALPEGTPPVTSIAVSVEADGTRIESIKVIAVADLPAENPAFTVLAVGGEVAGPELTLAAGQTYGLDIGVEPAPGEGSSFAWYSTAGEIEQYQSNPTELVAAEAPGEGWLFVVFRDGRGGVAWRGLPVTVE
jgi:hypothetical protein